MKKDRKKKTPGQLLAAACFVLAGFAAGIGIGWCLDRPEIKELESGEKLFVLAGALLAFYAAMFFQVIIHEGGHLIAGLLSGYHFSSFRIGSFMWVKEGGRIHFRRHSLAGTGGQCLMIPPQMKDGSCPTTLYNLGGPLLNLISVPLFLLLCAELSESSPAALFFLMCAVAGACTGLTNGIPLSLGVIDNDGYNALEMRKDKAAQKAFWIQMSIVEQTSQGVRLKDMPSEWFTMPQDDEMKKNSIITAQAVFCENRLMDEMEFVRAKELIDELLSKDIRMVGIHRNLLICDRILLELLYDKNEEVLNDLYTKELKKFMKQMQKFPSVIRTEYALAALYEKDDAKAQKALERFEKCSKTHPYPTDIESERELLELI